MSKLNKALLFLVLSLALSTYLLYVKGNLLKQERDKYQANSDALLTDMSRLQVDSSTVAFTVKCLRLSLNEYKQYRAEDATLIRKLGVRIKDLETAAKHDVVVEGPINATVKDTSIVRDSIPIMLQILKMDTPHLKIDGTIENNRLKGKIHLPVRLNQIVWVEYKHRFLWWRWKVKAVHQSMTSDNPYVQIKYSEFINIEN